MALARGVLPGLLRGARSPVARASGGGGQVRWGGQQFADPGHLVAWINARGGHTNVPAWLALHPGAAAIFRGQAPPNYGGAAAGPGLPPLGAGAGGTDLSGMPAGANVAALGALLNGGLRPLGPPAGGVLAGLRGLPRARRAVRPPQRFAGPAY